MSQPPYRSQQTRPPAVAGLFYPAEPARLRADVESMLAGARADADAAPTPPAALIVPHAGYVYSGPTAALAWARAESLRGRVRRVVLLGPAHRMGVRALALPGHRTTPFASLGAEAAARTIACTSPSKAFNLAGLQVANILIPDPGLRSRFRVELDSAGYSQPNTLGLVACRAAYEGGDAWLDGLREHIAAAREHVVDRLAAIPGVEAAPCEGTYLLWLDCTGLLAAAGLRPDELDDFVLEEAGLWLDDGAIFGAGGRGFTRINVACPRATLDEALDRLEAAVAALLSRQEHRAAADRRPPAVPAA